MIRQNVPLSLFLTSVTESHIVWVFCKSNCCHIYCERRTRVKEKLVVTALALARLFFGTVKDLRDSISRLPQMHLHAFMKCFIL